jgi:type IV secretory pathway ATPase VirB11/archaellum biosynthesis ATPase
VLDRFIQQAVILLLGPQVAGVHAVTIQDLLRLALRYRPDRIILGEVRAEAYHLIHRDLRDGILHGRKTAFQGC